MYKIYEEDYKADEIYQRKNLNKWRDIPWSWILKHTIVKMSVLTKLSYINLMVISAKIPVSYFVDIYILIL